ncbi:MAG: hypothetical protein Q9227_003657 [Pyrenula ochraceoflavens]
MASAQQARGFNDLPREIRDMIWDAAVRDDLPGVHFFSIFEREDDHDEEDDCFIYGFNDSQSRRAMATEKSSLTRSRLSAPAASGKAEDLFLWSANNPSTYLQDGGLWTACHESRSAILRSQKKRDWGVATCIASREIHRNVANNQKSMSGYFDNNGVRQYFAIGKNDLVCFRPLYLDLFYGYDCDIPFFPSPVWKASSLQHFAFEFDPNWTYPEDYPGQVYFWDEKDMLGCVASATLTEGIRIWLIDYGIERDTSLPNNSDIREDRHVFYGSGCRYVEVQASDREWDYPRLEGSILPGRETALYFADQLDEAMKNVERIEEWEFHMDRTEYEFDKDIETRKGAVLGVLACEYKQ